MKTKLKENIPLRYITAHILQYEQVSTLKPGERRNRDTCLLGRGTQKNTKKNSLLSFISPIVNALCFQRGLTKNSSPSWQRQEDKAGKAGAPKAAADGCQGPTLAQAAECWRAEGPLYVTAVPQSCRAALRRAHWAPAPSLPPEPSCGKPARQQVVKSSRQHQHGHKHRDQRAARVVCNKVGQHPGNISSCLEKKSVYCTITCMEQPAEKVCCE